MVAQQKKITGFYTKGEPKLVSINLTPILTQTLNPN